MEEHPLQELGYLFYTEKKSLIDEIGES